MAMDGREATGHDRRRAKVRVTPGWPAGGSLPGLALASRVTTRSHHLLHAVWRLQAHAGLLWGLVRGPWSWRRRGGRPAAGWQAGGGGDSVVARRSGQLQEVCGRSAGPIEGPAVWCLQL